METRVWGHCSIYDTEGNDEKRVIKQYDKNGKILTRRSRLIERG